MPMPMKPMCVREAGKRAHISTDERAERTAREAAALSGTHDHMRPPSYLTTAKMRDRFAYVVSVLHGCSEMLCTDADVDSVARYVMVEAEYLEAAKDLRACRARQKKESKSKRMLADSADMSPAERAKMIAEMESRALAEKRQLQQAHNQAFKSVTDAARAIGLTVDGRLRFDLREPEKEKSNRFAEFDR